MNTFTNERRPVYGARHGAARGVRYRVFVTPCALRLGCAVQDDDPAGQATGQATGSADQAAVVFGASKCRVATSTSEASIWVNSASSRFATTIVSQT